MSTTQQRLAAARGALATVQHRMGTREALPSWPVPERVAPALPDGLVRGRVTVVEGSTSLMTAVAASASADGAWIGVLGMPAFGAAAARWRGIDLSRLALVPQPGVQAAEVAGACVDALDVVLLGPSLALTDAARRRLAARARERGAAIVSAEQWSGAVATLTVVGSRWGGLGAGQGRLRSHVLDVRVVTRERPRLVQLALEVDDALPRSGHAYRRQDAARIDPRTAA